VQFPSSSPSSSIATPIQDQKLRGGCGAGSTPGVTQKGGIRAYLNK